MLEDSVMQKTWHQEVKKIKFNQFQCNHICEI